MDEKPKDLETIPELSRDEKMALAYVMRAYRNGIQWQGKRFNYLPKGEGMEVTYSTFLKSLKEKGLVEEDDEGWKMIPRVNELFTFERY